ncbi:hypothetical protein SETIT_8G033600v2 [Setaria italica]|uniref:Uncharacterized protein n=1 Tax=Setaria italica TaxID=4555 RepID=A0A368S3R8_SETIT|nr:hypothetical protein SETIT_8G033600v2 [Setaria italica]
MLLVTPVGEFQIYYSLMTRDSCCFFVTLLAIFDSLARELTSGPLAMDLKLEVPDPVFLGEGKADGRLSLLVRSVSFPVKERPMFGILRLPAPCCALFFIKPWCGGSMSVFVGWP